MLTHERWKWQKKNTHTPPPDISTALFLKPLTLFASSGFLVDFMFLLLLHSSASGRMQGLVEVRRSLRNNESSKVVYGSYWVVFNVKIAALKMTFKLKHALMSKGLK